MSGLSLKYKSIDLMAEIVQNKSYLYTRFAGFRLSCAAETTMWELTGDSKSQNRRRWSDPPVIRNGDLSTVPANMAHTLFGDCNHKKYLDKSF